MLLYVGHCIPEVVCLLINYPKCLSVELLFSVHFLNFCLCSYFLFESYVLPLWNFLSHIYLLSDFSISISWFLIICPEMLVPDRVQLKCVTFIKSFGICRNMFNHKIIGQNIKSQGDRFERTAYLIGHIQICPLKNSIVSAKLEVLNICESN